jgi:hypothetical protein
MGRIWRQGKKLSFHGSSTLLRRSNFASYDKPASSQAALASALRMANSPVARLS